MPVRYVEGPEPPTLCPKGVVLIFLLLLRLRVLVRRRVRSAVGSSARPLKTTNIAWVMGSACAMWAGKFEQVVRRQRRQGFTAGSPS